MPPDDPLLAAMAPELSANLLKIYRRLRSHFREQAHARELTQAQHVALHRLADGRGHRMSELACHLELTAGACTSLIEKMAERGLVSRCVDPEDGRAVLISATDAGLALVEDVMAATEAYVAKALGTLSPAERHMAMGGVSALDTAFTAADEATP